MKAKEEGWSFAADEKAAGQKQDRQQTGDRRRSGIDETGNRER